MKQERTNHFLSVFLFIVVALFFSHTATHAKSQKATDLPSAQIKQKKVLFIGIDGFVWKTMNAANTPNLDELMKNSYVSTNALAETPTISGNGMGCVAYGCRIS